MSTNLQPVKLEVEFTGRTWKNLAELSRQMGHETVAETVSLIVEKEIMPFILGKVEGNAQTMDKVNEILDKNKQVTH